MTWYNTPCKPTLEGFASACPHGWIEVDSKHPHTIKRLWSVDASDLVYSPGRASLVHVLLARVVTGMAEWPDTTHILRVVHGSSPCNICGRQIGPEDGWSCAGEEADFSDPRTCGGSFPFFVGFEERWGTNATPVFWNGDNFRYSDESDLEVL